VAVHWVPLAAIPLVTWWLTLNSLPWVKVWAITMALVAGLKWLTFALAWDGRPVSIVRVLGYLFGWFGMDARAFLYGKSPPRPAISEVAAAVVKLAGGLVLIYVFAARLLHTQPLLAGWFGMVGVSVVMHFGLIHLMSIGWRAAGVDAPPVMNRPLLAVSVGDFWSKHWNVAFRDVAHGTIFRPALRMLGAGGALFAVFMFSGLLHELVISVPVMTGFGLPTLYFLMQAAAVLVEHSQLGKRIGLGRGWLGWAFTMLVVFGLSPILFHQAFVLQGGLGTIRAWGVGG
jgi:alginate O-acetyltransferase complex protein AlgI